MSATFAELERRHEAYVDGPLHDSYFNAGSAESEVSEQDDEDYNPPCPDVHLNVTVWQFGYIPGRSRWMRTCKACGYNIAECDAQGSELTCNEGAANI